MVTQNSRFTRRLLLVEDDQLTRGLVSNLLDHAGFEVHSCGSATEAAEMTREFDPDVMVVDISLGEGPTGIDLVQAMKNAYPHIAFVVLSNYAALPASFKEFRKVAYLRKRDVSNPEILIRAVEELLRDVDPGRSYPIEQDNELRHLTQQQKEVLALVAKGLSNKEIAHRRQTTVQSTEQLIGRIYKALGLKRDSARSMRVQATKIYNSLTGSFESP